MRSNLRCQLWPVLQPQLLEQRPVILRLPRLQLAPLRQARSHGNAARYLPKRMLPAVPNLRISQQAAP